MSRVPGDALQGRHDHRLNLSIADRARTTGARLIHQAIKALSDKTRAPLRGRRPPDPQTLRDLRVLQPLRGGEYHPRSHRQRLSALPPPRPGLQLLALAIAQQHLNRSRIRHTRTLPPTARGLMNQDTRSTSCKQDFEILKPKASRRNTKHAVETPRPSRRRVHVGTLLPKQRWLPRLQRGRDLSCTRPAVLCAEPPDTGPGTRSSF